MQKRASNDLLTEPDLQRLFTTHTAALHKSAAAGIQAALHQHLQALLPEQLQAAAAIVAGTSSSSRSGSDAAAAAKAAADAWRRAGGRDLPDVFRRFAAVDELMSSNNEERWTKQIDDLKLVGWRSWVDEMVWGQAPAAPREEAPVADRAGDYVRNGSVRDHAREALGRDGIRDLDRGVSHSGHRGNSSFDRYAARPGPDEVRDGRKGFREGQNLEQPSQGKDFRAREQARELERERDKDRDRAVGDRQHREPDKDRDRDRDRERNVKREGRDGRKREEVHGSIRRYDDNERDRKRSRG